MSTPENKVETDATKVLSDIQKVSASLVTDVAKVKVWYKDYRVYIGFAVCLILGIYVGAKFHL